jgi:hypothetical protein
MTTELDSADSIPRGFLSFSLISQEIVSVLLPFTPITKEIWI